MAEQTFNFTGALQTFTVPANVISINIRAVGAAGGDSGNAGGAGGRGALIQGDFSVTPGETLSILGFYYKCWGLPTILKKKKHNIHLLYYT